MTLSQKKICQLCGREIPDYVPQSLHHLVPKSKGGKGGVTVLLHHICHKQIHAMINEKELASTYSNFEAIRKHPRIEKFVKWIRKRPPEFISRSFKLNKNK